ncbi:uncharacterized protein [Garra rufa]|uniref:uncharacterized protein n=1 Tax=Garra rufa TaxID=137080 RepID=UPI003CCEAF9F
MEEDSVTLNCDDTDIEKRDQILWRFGYNNILIAKMNRQNNESRFYDDNADGRFRDRLKLEKTGSLTITNARTTDSGLYKVTSSRTETPLSVFNLTVYAHLPIPVITTYSPKNASSSGSVFKCAFLCSVGNVSDVTVSWYKGNSVFSSISVSDLSRSLSLHLECLDDSYSCVVNNPISNQRQHLNNTELCQPCSEVCILCCGSTEVVIRLALSALVGVATVVVLVHDLRSRNLQQKKREQTSHTD